MTVLDAINEISALKKHGQDQETMIKWLSFLDGKIKNDCLDLYMDPDCQPQLPYTPETAATTTLIVPFPFSELYVYYLMQQISLFSEDAAGYNNAAELFNSTLQNYKTEYARTHTRKTESHMIVGG